MKSIVKDYDNIMEHPSNRPLIPPRSPGISNDVGSPMSNPRIGLEYQVEVPSMIKKSERLKLLMNPADSELAQNGVEDNVAAAKLNNSWSDGDVQSFLLGLFIFGKNFAQIKRFLENRGMGDILSFYYGKFYKSAEYRRWSECKKLKGRKCITGHKLFSGQKQRELLSRLTLHVSEEFKDALQQVFKSYSDRRISLEEYISSLKSSVGLGVLVEAVGIGKGKEDLTKLTSPAAAVEHGKKTKVFSMQRSKALSSLGPSDLINHLIGGYRLSKTKSNDIFWEAVWPHLLARGWHLEKLKKNQASLSSKNLVVFLLPGVKKFSRRKLVKGDHYFDSVSDVLSKVIAEPNLLKLEAEETKPCGCNEEEEAEKIDDNLENAVTGTLENSSSGLSQSAKNSEASLNQPTTNEELKHALCKFRSLAYEESFQTNLDRPNYKRELRETIDELMMFEDTMVEEDKHDLHAFVEIFDQAYPLSKQNRKCKEVLGKLKKDTRDCISKFNLLINKSLDMKSSVVELDMSLANLEKEENDLEVQLKTIQDKLATVRKQKDEFIAAKAEMIQKQKETSAEEDLIVGSFIEQFREKKSLQENQAKVSADLKVLIEKHNIMRLAHQP